MKKLRTKVAKAKAHGIVVGNGVVCMIMLTNNVWAARQMWDTVEFKDTKWVL